MVSVSFIYIIYFYETALCNGFILTCFSQKVVYPHCITQYVCCDGMMSCGGICVCVCVSGDVPVGRNSLVSLNLAPVMQLM